MSAEEMVEVTVFCNYHHIEYTFIDSLEENGLVKLTHVETQKFIPFAELHQVEKMIHMHQDLDINIAGIEAIVNMLQRVEQLQHENAKLKNQLRLYIHEL
ncbi:chaperone modulator CbpM [Mucilaginibacter agri]|uniref:MerR HTH family regulatory protein n=1 Tax=Mucilaginibacter agri TaxID=2695265 RepID=A0A966DTT0_9SPHI|nr:chaperone modulator CbpM [Mucilaginibacter agri]NCD69731.1 hypothetical protein [Mucilaginibacter agri]